MEDSLRKIQTQEPVEIALSKEIQRVRAIANNIWATKDSMKYIAAKIMADLCKEAEDALTSDNIPKMLAYYDKLQEYRGNQI